MTFPSVPERPSAWTRRGLILAAGAGALAACTTQPGSAPTRREAIDRRVDEGLADLFQSVDGAQALAQEAQGLLLIPRVQTAGFFFGGAYGEGALMVGPSRARVDYYTLSAASIGFQAGAAEYSQALFFMTSQALQDFRLSDGWELGAGGALVLDRDGAAAGVTTTRLNRPIVEVVYGQRGLLAGATLEGAKYNRIFP
jgi:lipid-binding SYLF domain-containing protein